MRRTESRDALHGDLCVASFVWDSSEDGPIPAGSSYLYGAVPEGSAAIGGYIHVTVEVEGSFDLYFGAQLLKTVTGPLAPGWHEFHALFENPVFNFGIEDEPASRLRITALAPIPDGQFAVYVFYVHSPLLAFEGVPGPGPDLLDELLLDDMSFVELDDSSSHILLSTS